MMEKQHRDFQLDAADQAQQLLDQRQELQKELENERERGRAEEQRLQTELAETNSALDAQKQEKQTIEGLLKETQLAKEELQSSSAAESRQAQADFAAKVAVMEKQHEDAQHEAAAAAAKLEEQRQELQKELEKERERGRAEEQRLQTELAETNSALEAERQEKQRIEGLLKETQLSKEELQSSSAAERQQAQVDFAAKVAAMEQQHEDTQREAAAAAAKFEEQHKELQKELENERERGRAEAQQLQTQLAETDSALEAEKQEKQRIEGLLKETQLAKEELQSSSAAESRQAEADFASKVAVMQQQHEDAQREAAAAAAKLEEQRQELQQELQKSSEKVQLQETNLKDAYTRQFELEIAIQTADEEKQELTSNVDSLTAERRAIELERDELQDSCEHTKKELNEVLQSHRAAEADLQRQLAELREESGFLETWHQTKVLELEQKIEKLNAENAEKVTILEKERKAVEEERDALQQHLDLTQQELDQAHEAQRATEAELTGLEHSPASMPRAWDLPQKSVPFRPGSNHWRRSAPLGWRFRRTALLC
ncbi:unnamed protein product [Durusdinium trenchii]|uniref:Uncharacterized protein n=1 Tax=Durusdinium trenchii TaxID=1381693 RepID=A0ABP0SSF9_9DINO